MSARVLHHLRVIGLDGVKGGHGCRGLGGCSSGFGGGFGGGCGCSVGACSVGAKGASGNSFLVRVEEVLRLWRRGRRWQQLWRRGRRATGRTVARTHVPGALRSRSAGSRPACENPAVRGAIGWPIRHEGGRGTDGARGAAGVVVCSGHEVVGDVGVDGAFGGVVRVLLCSSSPDGEPSLTVDRTRGGSTRTRGRSTRTRGGCAIKPP